MSTLSWLDRSQSLPQHGHDQSSLGTLVEEYEVRIEPPWPSHSKWEIIQIRDAAKFQYRKRIHAT